MNANHLEKRFHGDIHQLRDNQRLQKMEIEHVVSMCLDGIDLMNVLDIGTGSGVFAEAFAKRGLQVFGIDANPEMLAEARKYVPNGEFREAEAEKLPFPDRTFDLVFMGVLLHESETPLKVLSEARRVAKKRIGILEWPYQDEEMGPPLAHRIQPEVIHQWFQKVGFTKWSTNFLKEMVFYLLEIENRI